MTDAPPPSAGRLIMVGTPLGNRGDFSPRAREAVLGADLLLCEDTRSPSRLLPDVTLPTRMSCFVGNEHERIEPLLAALGEGKTVVFISEAGMPGLSDPGRRLVGSALGGGYTVDVIPGPTAAATALCHTDFAADAVLFVGFIARSGPERAALLRRVAGESATTIFYEAGNRTPALIRDLADACPDAAARRVAVARELTKLHQEVVQGALEDVRDRVTAAVRGEVTVVLEGVTDPEEREARDVERARAVLDAMLDPDARPRERAKRVAEATGLDAREIYERLSRR
ncbi:MAG: SAM-dependent methyltransferase [Myxococcota bacterium]